MQESYKDGERSVTIDDFKIIPYLEMKRGSTFESSLTRKVQKNSQNNAVRT